MLRRFLPVVLALTLSACASPLAPVAAPPNFYDAVRNDVENFWTGDFAAHGATYRAISKMQLFTGQISIPCSPPTATGPAYCPTNQTVYLESGFMQTELSDIGDFGPAIIIGHEIGHHVQNLLQLQAPFNIFKELQADCFAGGWMKDARSRDLLEVSDFQEAANSLFGAGDFLPWFNRNAHGTPAERENAFRTGFVFGVDECF